VCGHALERNLEGKIPGPPSIGGSA